MKELNLGGLINQTITLNNMIKEELQHDCKHAENARCRAGQWGGVAAYIEYAFGIKCTGEEVREELNKYLNNALK